jgi:hypothetical protein
MSTVNCGTPSGLVRKKVGVKPYFRITPGNIVLKTYDPWLVNYKVVKTLNNLRPTVSGTVAEIDEVTAMLLGLLGTVNTLISCFTRPFSKGCRQGLGGLKKKYGSIRGIPSAVLEVQFGLKPLCQDLATLVSTPFESSTHQRVVVKTRQDYEYVQYGAEYTDATKQSVSTRTVLHVSFLTSGGPIDAGNPLEWIWERIPFSFVIDWCIGVGLSVAALQTLARIDDFGGTTTIRRVAHMKRTMSPQSVIRTLYPSTVTYKDRSRVIQDWPYIPMPRIDMAIKSKERLLNVVSLLAVLSSSI